MDGIYVCEGGRLSSRLATLAADPRLQQALEGIQRQLRQVGIDIVPVYLPGSVLFNEILPSGGFDLALSSYIRGPGAPGRPGRPVRLRSGAKLLRLLPAARDSRARSGPAHPGCEPQAGVLNRADAQLANDVPVIPMYQNPVVAASTALVRNVGLGVYWDALANAEDWWLAEQR